MDINTLSENDLKKYTEKRLIGKNLTTQAVTYAEDQQWFWKKK